MKVETKRLGYGIPLITAVGFTFGELLKIAMPVVKAFHSDLYSDALWLRSHLTDETTQLTFYYQVRECGTLISTLSRDMNSMGMNGAPVHRLTYTRQGSPGHYSYSLTIESPEGSEPN